ncbi:putative ABC transport system permease protein [Anaerosolibacter carboniphilus]|uniref:Putative ABC transport system permease protein n=1 Tax=Anaerosolibacter carboniphilus TaxID=1417629 RepID=A0A841KZ28_9FIRM|nr:FtsX-like permease family protein [Anaerosolibacter carboniphilus]MBB6218583.1 putative ABC transport system permease protein [Anaerosolibacter carboniphilus]
MWIFLKKFYRDLGESKGQFISVLAVVIIGVMFYTGLNSALENLSESGNKHFKDYRLADLWSSVYRAPEGVMKRIETIPGVQMAIGRIVRDVRISMPEKEATVRLISLPDEKSIIVNDIQLKSGSYFSMDASNQCIVSESFFKANRLSIGQTIEPIINGDRLKLKVVGTAKSPEYVLELRDGSEMIPDPTRFGVIYVKKSYLQSILDFKGSINDINVLLNQEGDIKKVKDELKRILKPYGVISTIERKDQISYSTFDADVTSLKSMAAVFPMLFFIASAVIIYITMTRMIENQRTQMGVLKALGYSNLDIMLHYQTYPLLVGILGSITGSIMGVFIVGSGLLNLFNMMYSLPIKETTIHGSLVLPAASLALLFCIAAGYNACRKELYLVPAQSMRQKPPASGKKMFLENISLLWERINFSWKIILRNLFRYKKRSAMASVGIIFSMALLLVAFGLKNSIDDLMRVQFSEIQKYDIKISFSKIMNSDELSFIRSIDHIQSIEPILESGMEITNGWMKKDIGLIALEKNSTLYGVLDKDGKPVALPQEGILLPERLLNTLDLQIGEKAYLRSFYPGKNEEKDKKEVNVKGVIAQYTGQSAICSADYLDYLLKEGLVTNAAYITLENPEYEKEVIDQLRDILTISTIQSKSEVVANNEKMLESMNSVIVFMILGAGILAFAVIYNIANINIFERRREIATLSVLGFIAGELKSVVFNENFFISSFGIIAGIPLGRFLLEIVIKMQTTDNMQLPVVLNLSSYWMAALLITIFTATANLLLTKKIISINMVESLKSAE